MDNSFSPETPTVLTSYRIFLDKSEIFLCKLDKFPKPFGSIIWINRLCTDIYRLELQISWTSLPS